MSAIIGTMLTQPVGSLATSALPNAPVVEEPARAPRTALQVALAGTLRRVAAGSGRLAERIEPRGSHYSPA
jgi:hypothetical protein